MWKSRLHPADAVFLAAFLEQIPTQFGARDHASRVLNLLTRPQFQFVLIDNNDGAVLVTDEPDVAAAAKEHDWVVVDLLQPQQLADREEFIVDEDEEREDDDAEEEAAEETDESDE